VDSYLESACTQSLDIGHQFDSHGTAAAAAIAAAGIEEFGAPSRFERPLMSGLVVVAAGCGHWIHRNHSKCCVSSPPSENFKFSLVTHS
jgi:hypothetical protein